MATARIELPQKLIPIFTGEADVRGAHGGRGSGKTRGFAKMTAVRAYMWSMAHREGVILCGRQFMNSLDDSSMEEVKAAIRSEPWLHAHFDIGEKYIRTLDGRISYKFAGLDRNLDSIKSKARILLCWVDEAEPVTEEAWGKLIPTIREEDSELWVTWNPERKSSPTHKRFRMTKDPRVKVTEINWRDNPWFPEILNRVRMKDQEERPDTYDHVWEGAFGSIHGAILSKWVSRAEREGRVSDEIVFDPAGAPIEISSDLGFRDTASWWYWQRVPGGFNLLKYEGESGMDAQDWIPTIKDNMAEFGGKLGKIWLPHDARAKTFQSKKTSMEQFLEAFGPQRMGIVPQSRKADQISAAREVINRCAFNKEACEPGLDGLSAWEFEWNEDLEVFSREPIHNWACFVAGTMVQTTQGDVPIEKTAGMWVLTPSGPRKVQALHEYQSVKFMSVELSDGRRVVCTPEHRFFTDKGLVPADALTYDSTLYSGGEWTWRLISWILKASATTGIHQAITDSFQQKNSPKRGFDLPYCSGTCGKASTAPSQMGMKYITGITTRATTSWRILSACLERLIDSTMVLIAADVPLLGIAQKKGSGSTPILQKSSGSRTRPSSEKDCVICSRAPRRPQSNGTKAMQGQNGTAPTAEKHGKTGKPTTRFVRFAVKALLLFGPTKANTAGRIVGLRHFDSEAKVYDLTVEHDHCYVAGGVLVSNSHPSDAFAYGCQVMQEQKPPIPPKPEPEYAVIGRVGGRMTTAPLDDLWKTAPAKSKRI